MAALQTFPNAPTNSHRHVLNLDVARSILMAIFPGEPGLAGVYWSKSSQIVTTNKRTTSFIQAKCSPCCPTNSVTALKGYSIYICMHMWNQSKSATFPEFNADVTNHKTTRLAKGQQKVNYICGHSCLAWQNFTVVFINISQLATHANRRYNQHRQKRNKCN